MLAEWRESVSDGASIMVTDSSFFSFSPTMCVALTLCGEGKERRKAQRWSLMLGLSFVSLSLLAQHAIQRSAPYDSANGQQHGRQKLLRNLFVGRVG